MSQQRIRSTTRTWGWLLAASTVAGMIIAFALSTALPAPYRADVTLLVTPNRGATGITNSDLQVAQAMATTFAELATTSPVLRRVIEETGADIDRGDLSRAISTHVPSGTSLLELDVRYHDASGAAALANALAAELQAYQPPGLAPDDALKIDLAIVDPASAPTTRDGLSVPVRTLLGGAIGLFLAISVIFLIENIWPQSRGALSPQASSNPPSGGFGRTSLVDDEIPIDPDVDTPAPGPVAYDPLRSATLGTDAKTAARGVINELEMERIRPSE